MTQIIRILHCHYGITRIKYSESNGRVLELKGLAETNTSRVDVSILQTTSFKEVQLKDNSIQPDVMVDQVRGLIHYKPYLMRTEGSKIQRMNTQYYSRMFSELKKAIQSPTDKSMNSTIRPASGEKRLRINKNHVTLNINKLDKLHISNASVKKSNISSYFATPLEKSIKKKNLKSQPNTSTSVLKMKFNACQPDGLRSFTQARYQTEVRQNTESWQRDLQVEVEFGSQIIKASFKSKTKIQDMKVHLFRQMLLLNRNNTSEMLNLVTFESVEQQPDSFVDYWMGQPNQTLQIFVNNNILQLKLRPMFSPVITRQIGLEDFIIYRCVGVGGFSKVFLAKCKLNGKLCALKFISKAYIVNNKKTKLLFNEKEILAGVDSPSVITLYHAFETKNYVVFSLEYCPNNELYQYLREKERLNEDEGRQMFKQILAGISYLHSKKVLYRDIKLQNLLIDAQGHVKITDFGLSKPNCDQNQVTYSYCGSPQYMAPQMLLKCGHSYEVDYYALGILLYELLVGVSPFSAKTKAEIYHSAINNQVKFPKEIPLSKEVKNLLLGLLHKNPANRIGSLNGVKQIFAHPWVAKKGETPNGFAGKIFKEYRQVKESDMSWLEEEFQYESRAYQKQFKHIHYENIAVYKQRINQYLRLEQQHKKCMTRPPSAVNSPLRVKNQSRFQTKNSNPFLKKLR